jgi:hypothetical protein
MFIVLERFRVAALLWECHVPQPLPGVIAVGGSNSMGSQSTYIALLKECGDLRLSRTIKMPLLRSAPSLHIAAISRANISPKPFVHF